MKEALYWKKIKRDTVQCFLCPRFCIIKSGERGNCGVRENQHGKLISLVYGRPCSVNADPIEKKPFYHFLPGEETVSIATAGCNLHCLYCQNWEISQCRPEYVPSTDTPPEKVIEETKKIDCRIISYTYTEPTVFYEYMFDTSKLAKKQKKKLRNTMISNGFINPEPLKEICKYLDGVNIDLKGDRDFYEKIVKGKIKPILKALKILKRKGIWIELTNLIIPGENDSEKDLKWLIGWIKENLGTDVPLHFSAFHPMYKLTNLLPTPEEVVKKARKTAMSMGLHYVYSGNIQDKEGNTTFCPSCGKAVIERISYKVIKNILKNGKCPCGKKIAGVWK